MVECLLQQSGWHCQFETGTKWTNESYDFCKSDLNACCLATIPGARSNKPMVSHPADINGTITTSMKQSFKKDEIIGVNNELCLGSLMT